MASNYRRESRQFATILHRFLKDFAQRLLKVFQRFEILFSDLQQLWNHLKRYATSFLRFITSLKHIKRFCND